MIELQGEVFDGDGCRCEGAGLGDALPRRCGRVQDDRRGCGVAANVAKPGSGGFKIGGWEQ